MIAKPHPWQPSPIIISQTENLDLAKISALLKNLQVLTDQAQRNIPVLVLGPQRNHHQTASQARDFSHELMLLANTYHHEYLGLWNMTLQSTMDVSYTETERLAVVQAMMISNWLSRLPTS